MNIEIKIMADSVEEMQAALAELGRKPVNFVTDEENARAVAIPAVPEPMPESTPEKPKRKRVSKQAAEMLAEITQEPVVEPEAPQAATTPAEPEKPAEKPQEAPELGAPQYGEPAEVPTIDQIAAAGAKLLDEDAGKMQELLDLLGSFGVQAITQLKQEQLADFAAALRNLGAEV